MGYPSITPPPVNATEAEKQAHAEEVSKKWYLASWRQPLLWEMCVRRHWRAAEILYERAFKAKESNARRMQKQFEEVLTDNKSPFSAERTLEGEELEDYLEEELIQDYYLLIGYTLECALKGYLFALLPEIISDTDLKIRRDFRKIVLIHNLSQLCHECGIEVSGEQSELLDYLTFQIEHGKYPAAKEKMAIPRIGGDLFAPKPMADALVIQAWKLLRSLKHGGKGEE